MFINLLIGRSMLLMAKNYKSKQNIAAVKVIESYLEIDFDDNALNEMSHYINNIDELSEDYDGYIRFKSLVKSAQLDELGETVLSFALLWLLFPKLAEECEGKSAVLTLEKVLEYSMSEYCFPDDYVYLLSVSEAVEKLLISDKTKLFFRRELLADIRILEYLHGKSEIDSELKGCASLYFGDDINTNKDVHKNYTEKLALAFSDNIDRWMHIHGSDESELPMLVKLASNMSGKGFLMVEFDKLFQSISTKPSVLRRLYREAMLSSVGVCIYGMKDIDITEQADKWNFLINDCVDMLKEINTGKVCFCSDNSIVLTPYTDKLMLDVSVNDYTRVERIELWKYYLELEGITEVDAISVGSKYLLNREQIAKATKMLKVQNEFNSKSVAAVCEVVMPPPRQGNIKKISAKYELDQLMLLPQQQQVLEDICNHVRYKYQVYDVWDMDSKYAYGKNVSALIVGPPGTGKTMAVHVLSNILQLPLYCINLAQVVDKYIGETEKRLEEIFSAAEKSNVILFFDEADSIFGKRSEVNDAKDKYANTEVSYILQRMEQYEGVVILATNFKKNIDEAFMRRMRYLVEFPMPDAQLRCRIWKSVFADKVPLGEMDFEYVANQFEFSGGSIKNIALNATFLAASRGESVTMKDILLSVKNENTKMGKSMVLQDFGKYYISMIDEFK